MMASIRIEALIEELQDERAGLLNDTMSDTDQNTMPLWAELTRNEQTLSELEETFRLRRRNRLRADDARCEPIYMAFDLIPGVHYGRRPPIRDWPMGSGAAAHDCVELRAVDWNSPSHRASEENPVSPWDVEDSESPGAMRSVCSLKND